MKYFDTNSYEILVLRYNCDFAKREIVPPFKSAQNMSVGTIRPIRSTSTRTIVKFYLYQDLQSQCSSAAPFPELRLRLEVRVSNFRVDSHWQ
eukprot:1754814-Rhodomonas_salina.1